jgi:hypothetical protein
VTPRASRPSRCPMPNPRAPQPAGCRRSGRPQSTIAVAVAQRVLLSIGAARRPLAPTAVHPGTRASPAAPAPVRGCPQAPIPASRLGRDPSERTRRSIRPSGEAGAAAAATVAEGGGTAQAPDGTAAAARRALAAERGASTLRRIPPMLTAHSGPARWAVPPCSTRLSPSQCRAWWCGLPAGGVACCLTWAERTTTWRAFSQSGDPVRRVQ